MGVGNFNRLVRTRKGRGVMNRRVVFSALAVAALACCLTFSNFDSRAAGLRVQTSELPTLALGRPLRGLCWPVGMTQAGARRARLGLRIRHAAGLAQSHSWELRAAPHAVPADLYAHKLGRRARPARAG